MGARRIGPNYRSVTGTLYSQKHAGGADYESPLEHDFYVLLEFDPLVTGYEPQPVEIPYTKPNGRRGKYYPDTLVRVRWGRSLLYEVKPYIVLRDPTKRDVLLAKCRAGRHFARENGWRFRVITDRLIRTPCCFNAEFLLPFRRRTVDLARTDDAIMRVARSHARGVSVAELISGLDYEEGIRTVAVIWTLVAQQRVFVNLSVPLTEATCLFSTAQQAGGPCLGRDPLFSHSQTDRMACSQATVRQHDGPGPPVASRAVV